MDSDAEPTALSADDLEDLPQEADDDDAGDGIEGSSDSDSGEVEGEGSPAVRGRKRKRKKKKAKPKGKAAGGKSKFDKKKRGKVVNGKKWCKACQKWLDVKNFPVGSAQCAPDRKIIQNLRNAAIAQNQQQWFEDLMGGTEERLAKVVKSYKARVEVAGGSKKKAGSFPILQYEEEVKQETAIIVDGVMEMMHKAHYIAWMGKAKNGMVDADTAAQQWLELYNKPGAITDLLGPNAKYKERVAIKKSDLVKFRDSHIKGQGYKMKELEKKKASKEDIDKADDKMQKGFQFQQGSSSDRTAMDTARHVASARAAAAMGSGADFGASAFSEGGRAAQAAPAIRELDSSDEEDDDGDTKCNPDEGSEGEENNGKGKRKRKDEDGDEKDGHKGKKAKKTHDVWFTRDDNIAAAVKAHEKYTQKLAADLTNLKEQMRASLDAIPEEHAKATELEARLVRTRLMAIRS